MASNNANAHRFKYVPVFSSKDVIEGLGTIIGRRPGVLGALAHGGLDMPALAPCEGHLRGSSEMGMYGFVHTARPKTRSLILRLAIRRSAGCCAEVLPLLVEGSPGGVRGCPANEGRRFV